MAVSGCAGRPIGDTEETERNPISQSGTDGYMTEEVYFSRDGMNIYGKLYLPESDKPLPVAIIEHGFGGNCTQVESYAVALAENGIAACAFDFIGGGSDSRSDGKITEMSVLTEAADLNAVIDALMEREEIDHENIFLLGGSQGGFVASYVAGKRPQDIRGLIALYPAYVLQDNAWSRTPDPESIPDTMELMGTTIGRIYNADAMSFDIFDVIRNYPGNVLIIHGTRDNIAPISYSKRAIKVFPSAKLIKIEGAGHGFYGRSERESAEMAVDFVKSNILLQGEGKESVSDEEKDKEVNEETEADMKIKVSDGQSEVIFSLNGTTAARSLYEQLPLKTQVEDYSTNEKIFYPPEGLDTEDVIEGDGPFGTLAYFSPWGNVVMYYSECGKYHGLYLLGEAIEGAENIEKLSGTINIEAID